MNAEPAAALPAGPRERVLCRVNQALFTRGQLTSTE